VWGISVGRVIKGGLWRTVVLTFIKAISECSPLLEAILYHSTTLILSLQDHTVTMARNRKPPGGRTTATSDASLSWEAAGDDEDTVRIADQCSVSFPLTLYKRGYYMH
jgi:hypothetical protein